MTKHIALATVIATALATPAAADTYVVDKQHTEAAFQVRHLVTKVRGVFRDVDGTINFDKVDPSKSSVEFHIRATSVETGVDQRDQHLRSQDFFWVEKYPEITFKSTNIAVKAKDVFAVTGDLTIRGVTKQVTLPVTFLGEEKDPYGNVKAGFETAITVNRKDYGLIWNKTLDSGGLFVADDVDLTVNLEAAKTTPAGTK